jgi:hypothetical protein
MFCVGSNGFTVVGDAPPPRGVPAGGLAGIATGAAPPAGTAATTMPPPEPVPGLLEVAECDRVVGVAVVERDGRTRDAL